MRYDFEGDMYDIAHDATSDCIGSTLEAHRDVDFDDDDEWMEIKEFVLRQMKAAKDAPESSQDILREHEAEIGF